MPLKEPLFIFYASGCRDDASHYYTSRAATADDDIGMRHATVFLDIYFHCAEQPASHYTFRPREEVNGQQASADSAFSRGGTHVDGHYFDTFHGPAAPPRRTSRRRHENEMVPFLRRSPPPVSSARQLAARAMGSAAHLGRC